MVLLRTFCGLRTGRGTTAGGDRLPCDTQLREHRLCIVVDATGLLHQVAESVLSMGGGRCAVFRVVHQSLPRLCGVGSGRAAGTRLGLRGHLTIHHGSLARRILIGRFLSGPETVVNRRGGDPRCSGDRRNRLAGGRSELDQLDPAGSGRVEGPPAVVEVGVGGLGFGDGVGNSDACRASDGRRGLQSPEHTAGNQLVGGRLGGGSLGWAGGSPTGWAPTGRRGTSRRSSMRRTAVWVRSTSAGVPGKRSAGVAGRWRRRRSR